VLPLTNCSVFVVLNGFRFPAEQSKQNGKKVLHRKMAALTVLTIANCTSLRVKLSTY